MELLDPYIFNLHTTLGHHGHSINCGHYTASINCCEKIIPTIQEFLMQYQWYPQHSYYCTTWSAFGKTAEGGSCCIIWIRLCSYYVVVVVVVWGIFNAVDTLVYSNQAMYAQSHLRANCHCRRTSQTLVTRRTGADSPATYMIWMGMMTVIHKKSQLFFKIKSFRKWHLMKTLSNSLIDLQTG